MEKLNKQQVKTILLNAPKGSDYSIIINGLVSKGYVLEGFNDQPKPQEDGIIKGAVKDVANTLLIKPATRVGQAIGGTISQSIINKMPDSDPNKAIYQANLDKQLSQDTEVPLFGKIESQKGFGDGGERQITSESLKIGSYLFPYGKVASKVGGAFLGSSTKLTPTAIKTAKTVGNVVSGASGGYMADVGYNLADENKTLGESFIPGAGTGLGVGIPLLGPAGRALKGKGKTGADVTNRVIHGTTTDVPLAEQAFKNIDTTGVKTRKELSDRLASAMENQMNVVDQQLAKDTRALSLDDYTIRVKNNAGQEVKTDVITQGLEHLEEFYKNAGDNLSASNVSLLKQKAVEQGLTHQEVNNIARMYSEEFGTKAFNKMGDPLTNVNAQMYQNTRSGLKQAARGGLGYGEEAAQADRLYNAMSNTKRLIDDGVEQVNKLQGKLKERNVVQKLSYGAAKILNTLTGGGLKAGVEALGVSNVGNKIDNWIDFERTLSKDLEFIRKANSIKSDSALIKFIEDYAKKFKFPGDAMVDDLSARGKQIKATPNKNGGFVRIGQSEKATNQRMNSTIKNNIPKTSSISPKSTTVTQKVKGTIPENSGYKQYTSKHIGEIENSILSDKSKAVVIDSDTIKKMHPNYNPKKPQILHDESSKLSKQIYNKAVDEDSSGVVKFTGGGSGSGKSEIVLSRIGGKPSVIFDGTMGGLDSIKTKIDYALSKGKKVELHPVYTPPELATLFNKMRGRTVSTDVLVDSHTGFRNTVPELQKIYGNKIKIVPYENKVFGNGTSSVVSSKNSDYINSQKMSSVEVKNKIDSIETAVNDYGLDTIKKVVNEYLQSIYK